MAKTRTYQHVCPVARSLEVIGEKWSLLIVRDLLRGPQRFTDLQRTLGNITAKWLTLRLRDLQAVGIVEADRVIGRREVWYRLTSKGRDLAPVVEALVVWGVDHASRPPYPGEPLNPDNAIAAMVTYRNRRDIHLPRPAMWSVRFLPDLEYTLRYDGARWSAERAPAEQPDLSIESTPEHFVSLLTTRDPADRARHLAAMHLDGAPDRIAEFIATFGRTRSEAATSGVQGAGSEVEASSLA